jgi:tetratricopeptide (TPR) repeat protein
MVVAAGLIVVGLAIASFQRNQVWGDEISLWQDVASKSPQKARPYNSLGLAMTDAGRIRESIEVFSRAIAINPLYYQAYNNLGYAYVMTGQSSSALPVLSRAINMAPEFVDPYINLALAYNQLRQFHQTVTLMERNLGLIGERVEPHYHLGVAYAFLGNREAARRQLEIVSRFGAADLVADLMRLLK